MAVPTAKALGGVVSAALHQQTRSVPGNKPLNSIKASFVGIPRYKTGTTCPILIGTGQETKMAWTGRFEKAAGTATSP